MITSSQQQRLGRAQAGLGARGRARGLGGLGLQELVLRPEHGDVEADCARAPGASGVAAARCGDLTKVALLKLGLSLRGFAARLARRS